MIAFLKCVKIKFEAKLYHTEKSIIIHNGNYQPKKSVHNI